MCICVKKESNTGQGQCVLTSASSPGSYHRQKEISINITRNKTKTLFTCMLTDNKYYFIYYEITAKSKRLQQ
uniref:Uncharacterized protein n=1 Tax=Anopheles atroparvus TaxID=41427 RepID=A0AAG5CT73_ANOAO